MIKKATKIGIAVISFVVTPVTTTRITKSKMGVKPSGLGAIEFGAMSLFSCTENSLFGFYCLLATV